MSKLLISHFIFNKHRSKSFNKDNFVFHFIFSCLMLISIINNFFAQYDTHMHVYFFTLMLCKLNLHAKKHASYIFLDFPVWPFFARKKLILQGLWDAESRCSMQLPLKGFLLWFYLIYWNFNLLIKNMISITSFL